MAFCIAMNPQEIDFASIYAILWLIADFTAVMRHRLRAPDFTPIPNVGCPKCLYAEQVPTSTMRFDPLCRPSWTRFTAGSGPCRRFP